jgi:hypothetical protein
MSRAKWFFGGTVVTCLFTIGYIHYSQQEEIRQLKKGVENDMIRQEFRKRQKELALEVKNQ